MAGDVYEHCTPVAVDVAGDVYEHCTLVAVDVAGDVSATYTKLCDNRTYLVV